MGVFRRGKRGSRFGSEAEDEDYGGVYIYRTRRVLEGWERLCLKGIFERAVFGKRVKSAF